MAPAPYLTVSEVAIELQMTADGVRKLIQRRKLAAVKVSERKTLVSRAALAAYRIALNATPVSRRRDISAEEQVDEFVVATGMAPREWLAAFKRDEFEDTPDTMQLLVRAASLSAEVPAPARV